MRKKLFVVICLWFISTLFIVFLGGYALDLPTYIRLKNNGQTISGKIIKWEENMRLASYSYEVERETFNFDIFMGKGHPYVGEDITVTYDKENPKIHVIGNLEENFQSTIYVFTFLSLIPTISTLIFLLRKDFFQ